MSEYTATITWLRSSGNRFTDGKYSRGHSWSFDCGITVPASSSPHVVPLLYSIKENVEPEEAFIAAISSCHMLTFLSISARKKFVVDRYVDSAVGVLEQHAEGKYAITEVTLLLKASPKGTDLRETLRLRRISRRRRIMGTERVRRPLVSAGRHRL